MAKNSKAKDIRETGPMTYEQLQKLNNGQFDKVSPEFEKYLDELDRRWAPRSLASLSTHIPQAVESSLSHTDTPWGESFFDEKSANANEFEHLEDIRAKNEPRILKLANGIAKGAILAGTTFIDGTVGNVLGLIEWANTGDFKKVWDNEVTNTMKQVTDASEKYLPNYYTEAEQYGPWYENLFSANFIGDKLIKNIGFSIGAAYSGLAFSGAMQALKLPQIIGFITRSVKAPKIVSSLLGSAFSAVNEGSIEALNGSNEFYDAKKAPMDERFRERYNQLVEEYEANKGKNMIMTPEGVMVDQAKLDFDRKVQENNNAYEKALAKLNEDKAKMGNVTLAMNIPILTAGNMMWLAKFFANGFRTGRKTLGITGRMGNYSAKTTKGRMAWELTKGPITEGTEEISQKAASTISGDYYGDDVDNTINEYIGSKNNPEEAQKTLSWAKSFGQGIMETVSDGSSWEEFFIGSLTGALGIPGFRSTRNAEGKFQSPIYIQEGIYNKWKDLKEQMAREQEIATKMNERFASPEFRNYYQGLIRHNYYQSKMDKAVVDDDEFEFKNAEHSQLVSDMAMFDNAGKLEDLETLIKSAFDIDDENLEAIVRNTTTTDESGKQVGPFIDSNGNPMYGTEEGKKEMIKKLSENRDEILNELNRYRKIKDDLDIRTGQRLSDDQLEELTWMKSMLQHWDDRAESMAGTFKPYLNTVINVFNDHKRYWESVRTEEGQKHADLTEKYNKADEQVRLFTRALGILEDLRGSDNKTLARKLSDPLFGEFYRGEAEHNLTSSASSLDDEEKEKVSRLLKDINRLGSQRKAFRDKLNEYLKNPDKQAENHENIKTQNQKREREKKVNDLKDKLRSATNLEDYRKILGDSLDDDDIKSQVLEELENENHEITRNYRETRSYHETVMNELKSISDPNLRSEAEMIFTSHSGKVSNLNEAADPASVYFDDAGIRDYFDKKYNVDEAEERYRDALYEVHKAMHHANTSGEYKSRFSPAYQKPPQRRGTTSASSGASSSSSSVPPTTPPLSSAGSASSSGAGSTGTGTGTSGGGGSSSGASTSTTPPKPGTPTGGGATASTGSSPTGTSSSSTGAGSTTTSTSSKPASTGSTPTNTGTPSGSTNAVPGNKNNSNAAIFAENPNVPPEELPGGTGILGGADHKDIKVGDETLSTKPENHKIVTNERYEELRKKLRAKLGQLNSGLDPEVLAIATEMALYHIEGGLRKFGRFAEQMIMEIGEQIKPYLKDIYENARKHFDANDPDVSKELTSSDEIDVNSTSVRILMPVSNEPEEVPIGDTSQQDTLKETEEVNESVTENVPNGNSYYRPAVPEVDIEKSKKGDFREFPVVKLEENPNLDFSIIYNYLKDHGAFDYLNKGLLKEGDEVGFMIDPEFEALVEGKPWHKRPTIFLVHGNQIIGSLDEGSSMDRFPGLRALQDKIIESYNKGHKPDTRFVYEHTTKVSKIMSGKVPYAQEDHSLSTMFDQSTPMPHLAIMKDEQFVIGQNPAVEGKILPLKDANGKNGRLYMLVPNGAGKYIPIAVRVAHFNKDEYGKMPDGTLKKKIETALDQLASATSQSGVSSAMKALSEVLFMADVMVNYFTDKTGRTGITISRKVRDKNGKYEIVTINGNKRIREEKKNVYFGSILASKNGIEFANPSPEDLSKILSEGGTVSEQRLDKDKLIESIREKLFSLNLPFNVDVNSIDNLRYIYELISNDVLRTNATKNGVVSTWFTLNPLDADGKMVQAKNPVAPHTSGNETRRETVSARGIEITGKDSGITYYIDVNARTITKEDGTNVPVTSGNEILFELAKAREKYGDATEGINMKDGKLLLEDGRVLDTVNQKYVTGEEAEKFKKELAGLSKPIKTEISLFDESLEALVNPDEKNSTDKLDGSKEGYFVGTDGKVHKGWLLDLGEIGDTGVRAYLTRITVTSEFGGKQITYYKYAIVYPNGKTRGLYPNGNMVKTEVGVKEATEAFMKVALGNSETIKKFASEKTVIARAFEESSNTSSTGQQTRTVTLSNTIITKDDSVEFADEITTSYVINGETYNGSYNKTKDPNVNSITMYAYKGFSSAMLKLNRNDFSKDEIKEFEKKYYSKFDDNVIIEKVYFYSHYIMIRFKNGTMMQESYNVNGIVNKIIDRYFKNVTSFSFNAGNTRVATSANTNLTGTDTNQKEQEQDILDKAEHTNDVIEITSTYDGRSRVKVNYDEKQEWAKTIDVRPANVNTFPGVEVLEEGKDQSGRNYWWIRTNRGLYAYIREIDGRKGDNMTLFFRFEPTDVVKRYVKWGFENVNNVIEVANNAFNLWKGKTSLSEVTNGALTDSSETHAVDTSIDNRNNTGQDNTVDDTANKTNPVQPSSSPSNTIQKRPEKNYDNADDNSNKYDDDEDEGILREVTENPVKVWNMEKELAWVRRVLPQLTEHGRIRIVKGLIKSANEGSSAWGRFLNGIITLSDIAAEGTLYHEAFHAVFRTLLDDNEKDELFDEARKRFGNIGRRNLEDAMAEEFREYVQSRSTFLGKIKGFFSDLYTLVTNFHRIRPSMNMIYRRINTGYYANRTSQSRELHNNVSKVKGLNFAYHSNPELALIGSEEQYNEYLKTIFPNSKTPILGSEKDVQGFREYMMNHNSRSNRNENLETMRNDIDKFLSRFGIALNDVDKDFDGDLFDAIEKVINIRSANDVSDGAGYAIAFMMQNNATMKKLLASKFRKERKLKENSWIDYTELNKDKQHLLKEIGKDIAVELRNLYGVVNPDEMSNNQDKSIISKIWKVIKEFFEKFTPRSKEQFSILSGYTRNIANSVKLNDTSIVLTSDTKPGSKSEVTRVDIGKALTENPYEREIIEKLNEKGISLAGSASIALSGTLYRPVENPLHDIDFQATGYTKEQLFELIRELFPYNDHANEIIDEEDNKVTETFLVLDRPFKLGKWRDEYGRKLVMIFGENGEILGHALGSELVLHEGVKGKFLDFFLGSGYPNRVINVNGKDYLVSDYRNAIDAKIRWARPKDIWDYNRFIPNDKKASIEDEDVSEKISKARTIWGHPAIGKTTYFNETEDIIDWDDEVAEKRNDFIREQIDPMHRMDVNSTSYIKIKNQYIREWDRHPEYVAFLRSEWNRLKEKAARENKKLFTSVLALLDIVADDIDLVINMPEKDFLKRNIGRGGERVQSMGWKQAINSALVRQDGSKVVMTEKYLSDLMRQGGQWANLPREQQEALEAKGWNMETFNSITNAERENLMNCIAF